MQFCLECFTYLSFRRSNPYFCPACLQIIKSLTAFHIQPLLEGSQCDHRVWTLFLYRSTIRDLILSAKIGSQRRFLHAIGHLMLQEPALVRLGRWADVIIPAPSSFWSRIRGCFDVAYFCADLLAKTYRKPIVVTPPAMHWRLRKRAHHFNKAWSLAAVKKTSLCRGERYLRKQLAKSGVFDQDRRPRILVVDDIVTTGFTMATVAAEFEDMPLRFLALANARDKKLSGNS